MSPLTKKNLFWDTNIDNINLREHKRYVIKRILKFGTPVDYLWLKSMYSRDEIKKVIESDRNELDKKSLNFWSHLYDIAYVPGKS